eukprot:NODE_11846_length_1262_cov_3.651982.p1 GENE.NODE_11846_length_1262_cov_3.651982~~NODE_11846_length_1262_cov_3.651982.p1  ORF type:complete len:249 (+),score=53.52 NODE_11846_length_1262_cov_3.651982:202-948(+)
MMTKNFTGSCLLHLRISQRQKRRGGRAGAARLLLVLLMLSFLATLTPLLCVSPWLGQWQPPLAAALGASSAAASAPPTGTLALAVGTAPVLAFAASAASLPPAPAVRPSLVASAVISSGPLAAHAAGTEARSCVLGAGHCPAAGRRGVARRANFQVTMRMPDGDVTFECDEEELILDTAEELGYDLPYSCRTGACSSCTAKIVSGDVDQSDQSYLSDEEVDRGYCLICSAYPKADVVIETHKEDEVNG